LDEDEDALDETVLLGSAMALRGRCGLGLLGWVWEWAIRMTGRTWLDRWRLDCLLRLVQEQHEMEL